LNFWSWFIGSRPGAAIWRGRCGVSSAISSSGLSSISSPESRRSATCRKGERLQKAQSTPPKPKRNQGGEGGKIANLSPQVGLVNVQLLGGET